MLRDWVQLTGKCYDLTEENKRLKCELSTLKASLRSAVEALPISREWAYKHIKDEMLALLDGEVPAVVPVSELKRLEIETLGQTVDVVMKRVRSLIRHYEEVPGDES